MEERNYVDRPFIFLKDAAYGGYVMDEANRDAGVDYSKMDPFKRMALQAGLRTVRGLEGFGFREHPGTRGESVHITDTPFGHIGILIEGLGTKNLVADALRAIAHEMGRGTNKTYYDAIAQCTFAMIVNDMITMGVLPAVVMDYLAAGDGSWFEDERRMEQFIAGWTEACHLAGCTWGGGETPTLKGVIEPRTVDLAGCSWGFAPLGKLFKKDMRDGDAIVFLASSGIHANGLSVARKLAAELRHGYRTELSDGRSFGEALLDPTKIYVPVIRECLLGELKVRYGVHITGHGWRKLMRAEEPFVYVIDELPRVRPVFSFIQEHRRFTARQMYETFNMGAGFAVFVDPSQAIHVERIARSHALEAWTLGHIEKCGNEKKVVIEPLKLEYDASTLAVR